MKKKILAWISFIIFIVFEILWSPLLNFFYSFFSPTINGSSQIIRDNFLLKTDNINIYLFVILIQLISLLSCLILMIKIKSSNKTINIMTLFVLIILIILTLFSLLILFYTRNGIV